MKQCIILLLGIIGLTVSPPALAQFGVRWQREAREFGWLTNYQDAKDEAKKAGKPIMLVFRCVP